MRTINPAITSIIDGGDFTGPNKACARVVIYPDPRPGIYTVPGWKIDRDGKDTVTQVYASQLFRRFRRGAKELPNVKNITWTRGDRDSLGSCKIELWNTRPLPPGTGPDKGGEFDQLGYYTYNRGRTSFAQSTWGHQRNDWREVLRPDTMIRVFQGYGEPDYGISAETDPAVVQTGLWLVDDVTYTADGLITLECRSLARNLSDCISFPPVVPLPLYPQRWEPYEDVPAEPTYVYKTSETGWIRPKYYQSSNYPYIGHGGVNGHYGKDAFDKSTSTYWVSIGNQKPNQGYSFEWVQGSVSGDPTLKSYRCKVWGGPYRVFLSVRKNGVWQGTKTVPYDPNNPASAPNGANIKFLKEGRVSRDGWITFNTTVTNVDAVRFTFTDLYNSGFGTYPYRAGVRDIQVSGTDAVKTTVTGVDRLGNFGDYSDVVKMLLAWGGFYWPQNGVMRMTGTNEDVYSFSQHDTFLQRGRIWGDIEMAGVAAKVPLDVQIFDKKPLLDGINYIADILGFIFFVDEHGAAQWRSPNTFRLGNWISNEDGLSLTRSTSYLTVRDTDAILGLRAKLSSRSLRDRVFIASADGTFGAVAKSRMGDSGFRRVGGWTDQNFASEAECQIMADMISLRQMWTYRQNSIRIPADPRVQIDDQVKLEERTTGEAYFHYVSSINSEHDLESGVWSYDLTTNWLGEEPEGEWAFKTTGLSKETIAYLTALGQL